MLSFMKFFTFSSTLLLATTCLAADSSVNGEQERPGIRSHAISIGLAVGIDRQVLMRDATGEQNVSLLVSPTNFLCIT